MTAPYVLSTAIGNVVVTNDDKLALGTTNIGAAAVTSAKVSPTGFASGSFTGKNGAGAITLTGAVVGQRVLALFEIDTSSGDLAAAAGFEATITVTNQIQQSSASNLSAKKYAVILVAAAA